MVVLIRKVKQGYVLVAGKDAHDVTYRTLDDAEVFQELGASYRNYEGEAIPLLTRLEQLLRQPVEPASPAEKQSR
jgi:hypothetical protein